MAYFEREFIISDLKAENAMAILLKDAVKPNLVANSWELVFLVYQSLYFP